MNIKQFFKRIFIGLKHPSSFLYPNSYSNERLIEYLKSKGAKIGEDTRFISPKDCYIDPGRTDYISIGKNCCFSVVSIIAHDYSWYTFLDAFDDIVPDCGGEVIIGNNVFIGFQSCILSGTNIGDNVVIGARSVVKGNIPANTVWAGSPARQICTLEELYNKRKQSKIEDAFRFYEKVLSKNANPNVQDMKWFSLLFLDRTQENYNLFIKRLKINGNSEREKVKRYFFNSQPIFNGYEDFVSAYETKKAQ